VEGPRTLRAVRSWQEAIPDHSSERGVREAMLLAVGALGYEGATVQEICERAGISRDQFHRRFGGKDECFAEAYEEAADQLCADVLAAGRKAANWRLGFRAALAELLRFVADQPLLAKTLLIEVRAARGRAWAKHQQVIERLVAAVDSARGAPGALPSTSSLTAGFMVGAIEESIVLEISASRAAEVGRLLPDLSHLVVLNYFGEDAAWLELRSTDAVVQLR
jgi:AcrR family transcriptional regulator